MFPLTLTNFYNLYGLKLGNMLAWSMFFGQAFSVGGPAAAGGAYLPGARGFAFTSPVGRASGSGVQSTLNRINSGGKYPHKNDGSVYNNNNGRLPQQQRGFYREYVHPTPGVRGPGSQRIVTGQGGQMWYTPNHYNNFILIK
jgi:guanyl-specific ribonuclease Sa